MISKKIISLLFVSCFALIGCKKEGCTDITAMNYNSEAKKDDGSCTHPTSYTVKSVKLVSHPNVDINGNPWTPNGANLDYILEMRDPSILYQSEVKTNASLPILFTIQNVMNIDIAKTINIYLYRVKDGNNGFINSCSIDLKNYLQKGGYPSIVSVSHAGYYYDIEVVWK